MNENKENGTNASVQDTLHRLMAIRESMAEKQVIMEEIALLKKEEKLLRDEVQDFMVKNDVKTLKGVGNVCNIMLTERFNNQALNKDFITASLERFVATNGNRLVPEDIIRWIFQEKKNMRVKQTQLVIRKITLESAEDNSSVMHMTPVTLQTDQAGSHKRKQPSSNALMAL